jgi:dienelactone hydrolase
MTIASWLPSPLRRVSLLVVRAAPLLAMAILSPGVPGEPVRLTLPGGLTAGAEFQAGREGRPAVLLVHGFLQTREFRTVARLATSLAEDGYPVLTPTLTLGIDQRRQSLSCEALHTHSMPQGATEIRAWSDWLANRSGAPLIAMGHSSGAIRVLAQASAGRHPALAGLVLISPAPFGPGPSAAEQPLHADRARRALQHSPALPVPLGLAFCRHYLAPPRAYLSYLQWDRDRSLQALQALAGLPRHAIFGGADARYDRVWAKRLVSTGVQVHTLPGADHFFDGNHEFELADAVAAALAAIHAPADTP